MVMTSGMIDLALNLGLRLGSGDLLLLALLPALQRGKAPLTLLLVKRVGDGEPAANAALLAAARRHGALLMASVWGAGGLLRLFLQEVLADGFLADLARLGLRLMALVLLDLALGGDLSSDSSLTRVSRAATSTAASSIARAPLIGLALAGVVQRPGARILLLIRELAQHLALGAAAERSPRPWASAAPRQSAAAVLSVPLPPAAGQG